MPSRYWGALFAAIGLAFTAFGLGAYVTALSYPEPDRYQSYGEAGEDKSGTATPAKIASAVQKHTPCENPESRDESDLCAQWRAANAAEESATWARIGFFAGLLGLVGLYWQVVLTRRAVEDTSEATEAMREANEIAGLGARPWLAFVELKIAWIRFQRVGTNWSVSASVQVFIENTGGTPAKDVKILCHIAEYNNFARAHEYIKFIAEMHTSRQNGFSKGIVAPGGRANFEYSPQSGIDPFADRDGSEAKDAWPAIVLSVIYKTVSGSEVLQTVQVFRLSMGKDNNSAISTGFWLQDKIYTDDDFYVSAGSIVDKAT